MKCTAAEEAETRISGCCWLAEHGWNDRSSESQVASVERWARICRLTCFNRMIRLNCSLLLRGCYCSFDLVNAGKNEWPAKSGGKS